MYKLPSGLGGQITPWAPFTLMRRWMGQLGIGVCIGPNLKTQLCTRTILLVPRATGVGGGRPSPLVVGPNVGDLGPFRVPSPPDPNRVACRVNVEVRAV